MSGTIRVLIVDNRKKYRIFLRELFASDPEILIVGEAVNGREAVRQVAATHPDVILMDLKMETENDGIEAIRRIRESNSEARVLVLSGHDEEMYFRGALNAGIQGYLIKDDLLNRDLLQAIHEIADGEAVFHPDVQKFVVEDFGGRGRRNPFELTEQERKVLALIAYEGLSNRSIGERLNLSEATVKDHVGHILSKLGVKNRTQAGLIARKRGIV